MTCPKVSSTYSTEGQINRLGAFCVPTDSSLADKFWNNPIISSKNSLVNGYDIILLTLAIGTCLGLLYLALVLCLPKIMTYFVFILAFIMLLIAGIYIFVKPVSIFSGGASFWNIVLGVILIILAFVFLAYFFCYQK